MSDANLVPADAGRQAVSTFLDLQQFQRHEWGPTELRDMLRHQLAAPLQLSLGIFSGQVAHEIRQARPAPDPLMTMHDLLHHQKPPLELLRLVKRFAKSCRNDPENPLPGEIVMLLYYASIGMAMMRLGEQISGLPRGALRRGLRWVSSQGWVDDEMRTLLRQAMAGVDVHRQSDALRSSDPDAAAAD